MTGKTTKVHCSSTTANPTVHSNYLYQFYQTKENLLSLYRINVGLVQQVEAWQPVALPNGIWHPDYSRLFSCAGRLFCILQSVDASHQPGIFSFSQTGQWKLAVFFPMVLFDYGIVGVESTLYVIGGCETRPADSPLLRTVHTCDLSDDVPQWNTAPDLPYGCEEPGVVTLGSHIHVLGYNTEVSKNKKNVMSMDLSEALCDRHWTSNFLPRLPESFCMPVVLNNNLVVLALREGYFYIDAYMYIPECHEYLELPSCRWSVDQWLPLVACDNKLCIVDGTSAAVAYLSV